MGGFIGTVGGSSFFGGAGGDSTSDLITGANSNLGGFGNFGDILGQEGFGLTGSKNQGTQQTVLDPTTRQIDLLRYQQLQQLFNPQNFGGYGSPLQKLSNYANLDPSSENVLAQALATNPQGLDYNTWNNSALANLNPNAQRGISSDLTGSNINALQGLVGQYGSTLDTGPLRDQFAQYSSQLGQDLRGYSSQLGQDASQVSQNAYQTLSGTGQNNLNYITGPLAQQLLGSGQDYFRQILSPQINNQHALLGLARSGANEEAQAKGAASISLPISQLIAQLASGANQQTQGLQAQNLGAYGLAQQNIGLNDIGNQQAVGLSGIGTQQDLGLAGLGFQSNLANLGIGGAQQNLLTNLQGQQGYGTQELQNLFSLGQQQPNVNIALQNAYLSRLGQQLQFADYPRQTGAGIYGGISNLYLSALNGTPYTPSSTTNTSGTGNTGVLTSVLGGGSGAGIGAAAGQVLGGGAATGAGGAGAAAAISDRKSKKNLSIFKSKDFLNTLQAYQYQYKHNNKPAIGVLAQDLEKTLEGTSIVVDTPQGKIVDYGQGFSLILACVVDINKRLAVLEGSLECQK